jgi:chemotaxis protein MotB
MKTFYQRRPVVEEDGNEWLVTFADAMTLLLAFFVLLVSISKVDLVTFEQVQAGIARDLGQRTVARPAAQLRAQLESMVDSLGVADAVRVDTFSRGITLELASDTFFRRGSAEIRPEARTILGHISETLVAPRYSKFKVAIEGHTADTPPQIARYSTNWELSGARAANIVRLFSEADIPAGRMRAVALADTMPKLPNRDGAGNALPENQAKNRRITIRIHR